ncbi:MAG: amidohydrolase family protein [Thermoplasmataceae archaeon]|jgi:imidazolonepropionase-like amidohydrolase
MKVIKATTLYDGTTESRDQYIAFDNEISYIGKKRPEGELIAEGIVTPAIVDGHSHIGMDRAGEPMYEGEANEKMDSIYPLVRAIDSIYMDDHAFTESVESGVLYSTVLPGSGNPIGGKAALIRNFAGNTKDAFIKEIGIKAALGYNPRSTVEWKGKRPSTRMGAVALLRENFSKAVKAKKLLDKKKKLPEEMEPLTEVFMDILSGKYKLMIHLHKEDDLYIATQLAKEFGFKFVVNHGLDIFRALPFEDLRKLNIPLIYGPLDSHPYKVELKHETWRNCEHVMKSGVKFGMMSDHPVILQRNMFYTMRHFLRFGMSKAEAISHVTSATADIIGAEGIGSVKKGYKSSMVVWSGDPFDLTSHPSMVIGEGRILVEQ